VDLSWAEGKLVHATIRSKLGGVLRLRTKAAVNVSGATSRPAEGPNPNPFFRIVPAGRPQVAPDARMGQVSFPGAHTIEFETIPGGIYPIHVAEENRGETHEPG
jgi:alpha-L-fucosidase 2